MVEMICSFNGRTIGVYQMTKEKAEVIQKFLDIQLDEYCTIENILYCDEDNQVFIKFVDWDVVQF